MTTDPEVLVDIAASRFGAKRLYRDAGSMATSTVANAVLGMAFWAIAAKLFPPEQLGVMTAVLAVIVAAGVVLASGIGDAYTAVLPAVGPARPRVYRRGQRVFIVLALITGFGCALVTTLSLKEVHNSAGVGILVALGVVVFSALTLQGTTLIALGRARLLPVVTIVVSVLKIALLPIAAITIAWHSVELAFVISAAVVVFALQPVIRRVISTGKELPVTASLPESRAVREFNRLVVQTMTASTLSLGLITITPFLVTLYAGPREGALFALSLPIVQTLDFISAAMGVSLVVHASSAPEQANAMARHIMIRSSALVVVGSVLLIAVVPVVLPLLNPQYGQMAPTAVISVLCLGSVIRVVYTVWSCLQKSRRNLKVPLILNFITAAVLLAIMPALAGAYGALGGAIAVLIPQVILSAGAVVHLIVTRRKWKDEATWVATAESRTTA